MTKRYYCRCSTFDLTKVEKNIKFPAYLQLKCDGSYREAVVVTGESVKFYSRTGKEYENPVLYRQMIGLPTGSYLGEWTIGPSDEPKKNRFEGNGLLNSKDPPYEEVIFTVWDYLPVNLWNQESYFNRFNTLCSNINNLPNVKPVKTQQVKDINQALFITKEYINKGLEGCVLKDLDYKFKNGTSNLQYKIKLQLDADMRITGFTEGTGKRKDFFGAIEFSNDEGTITGSCSGFTDYLLKEINKSREAYIGKIITVEFNDLIHQEGKYTLNHPRFLCIRNDKLTTDSLERVKQIKTMTSLTKAL